MDPRHHHPRTSTHTTLPDAELLISYLTVSYIKVPLVLTFFSTEDRVHSLRCPTLQTVLDSVLFEPGVYLPRGMDDVAPTMVPAENKRLLATSQGLLLNECARAPATTIPAATTLLKLGLDLDVGTYKSSTVPVLLYTIRMACRIDNYVTMALSHAKVLRHEKQLPISKLSTLRFYSFVYSPQD